MGRCEGRKPYGTRPDEEETLAMVRALRAEDKTTEWIAEWLNSLGNALSPAMVGPDGGEDPAAGMKTGRASLFRAVTKADNPRDESSPMAAVTKTTRAGHLP